MSDYSDTESEQLTASQQAAVSQLRELTAGGDDEVAISVLRSVDWDVSRAADVIFGGTGLPPQPPPPSRPAPIALPSTASPPAVAVLQESFEFDDSEQDTLLPRRAPHQHRPPPPNILYTLTRPLLSVLSFPFTLLSSFLRFLFTVLRLPLPRFSGLTFLGLRFSPSSSGSGPSSGSSSRPTPSTHRGPDRWVRELEDELGAMTIGRYKAARGLSSSSTSTSTATSHPSSSTLTSRGGGASAAPADAEIWSDPTARLLPDFHLSSYDTFLASLSQSFKVGCVILISAEHPACPPFLHNTLLSPQFVRALHENDVWVWGGEVSKDREAYGAAEKLQVTTFPAVVFVALQPRRTVRSSSSPFASSSSSNSPPTLTVLSRHQGPSTSPSSSHSSETPDDSAPTSAPTLTHHLTTRVLPRTTPYLARLLSSQRQLARDRQLREEQDRAFASAAQRDTERIQALMAAEEAARVERERQAEEARRRAEEERQREAERRRVEEERMRWRVWARRALAGRAGQQTVTGNKLRMAIRLPSGDRIVQQFTTDDTLTTLYATVDAHLVPPHLSPSDDPLSPPSSSSSTPASSLSNSTKLEDILDTHLLSLPSPAQPTFWSFRIVTSFPRLEVPWAPATPLGSVPQMKGGGQFVVELREAGASAGRSNDANSTSNGAGSGGESDGYDTEEE